MSECRRAFLFSTAFALLFTPYSAHAAPQPAGTLASLSGTVNVLRAGQTRPGAVNDPLFAGDLVTTGEVGAAKMIFADDSVLDLGPKSSFKVDSFQAKGSGDRAAIFSVLYGRLRALVTHA